MDNYGEEEELWIIEEEEELKNNWRRMDNYGEEEEL